MVYSANNMFPVEIDTSSCRCSRINHEVNDVGINCDVELIDEVRDVAHIREFTIKQKAGRRYNSKLMMREMQKKDLVVRQVVLPAEQRKLQSN